MTERILGPEGSKRRRRFLLGPMLAAALLAVFFAAGAQGVLPSGLLELDKNTTNEAAVAGIDWNDVYAAQTAATPGCPSGVIACSFDSDPDGATIFTTGGSKDDLDISSWRNSTGSVPDKDEITTAYAAMMNNPANSHQILFFGADRKAQNGSSDFGFWFFKGNVAANTQTGLFSGAHQIGDILVLGTFTQGGATATARIFKWVGTGGNATSAGTVEGPDASFGDCVPGGSGDGCSTVNSGLIPVPWPYTPKSGAAGSVPAGGFVEGGIDLSAIGLAGCFSSFVAETRSAPSVDATLKDFVGGSFQVCGANIGITPATASNEVGTNHVLTIHVNKKDPSNGLTFGPAANVLVTATKVSGPGTFVNNVNTCTTNASGDCNVTITSPTAGVTVISASASVGLSDGSTVSVSTTGTDGNSGNATKRWVDADLVITPLTATNVVGSAHTITATVTQDDGLDANAGGGDGATGFGASAGRTVTFSLSNNTAGASFVGGTNTCTSGSNGTCTVQINSSTPGSVTIHATTSFSLGPAPAVNLTRSTGGTGVHADANKTYVDGNINLSPLNDSDSINDNHTITATVTKNAGLGGGYVAAGSVLVTFTFATNNIGATFVGGTSTCTTNASGVCSIQITSSTAGTVVVHGSVSITVGGQTFTRETNGSGGNSGNANKTFVDGSLQWFKDDQNGLPLGGATFKVCRTNDLNSTTDAIGPALATPVCFNSVPDVTSGSPPAGAGLDQDGAAGALKLTHLQLGRYTIEEVSAPAGYQKDSSVHTLDLKLASPNAVDLVHFVNTRLFKMIVITCNESTNTLVVSAVTVTGQNGGVAKDTISAVPAALLAKTVTEADLCGIGGAAFGTLNGGTYSASAVIPKP